ncbi:RNA polymerase-associated protein Ctr9p [Trichomonascus vanleenenianus]|uniref:Ctr9p n=1 Tax=Trichomonascus vanleenenianus TaxID=2268995 RepID=UPI003ECB9B67
MDGPAGTDDGVDIPLHDGADVVTIRMTDMPDDPDELCTFLENEQSGDEYWLTVAILYARKGMIQAAMRVINAALERENKDERSKLPFVACLAWLYLREYRTARVQKDEASDAPTKESMFSLAMKNGNYALSLSSRSGSNALMKGALSLARSKFDEAYVTFQSALKESNDLNLFAQLGKARVLYHRKNYREALRVYQTVLIGRPDIKPDPRIGIGLCCWQLGDKETAFNAWARALEIDPENDAAEILVGITYLDRAYRNIEGEKFGKLYASAIEHAQKAYKIDSTNCLSSLVLAGFLYSKKELDSVVKLCQKVIDYTDVPSLKSDAYFWMGRAYHASKDYDAALENYAQAERLNGKNILPSIGKGLIQIAQESPEALITFEKLVENNPRATEPTLLLGLLYAKRSQNDKKKKLKAVFLLEKYIRLSKEANEVPTLEAVLMLSKLLEENTDKALVLLEEIIRDNELGAIEPHLHNNLGVFNYMKGNVDSARESFESALTSADEHAGGEKLKVTILFNIARLNDAIGEIEEAKKGYGRVLELQPDYLDARVRLAFLHIIRDDPDAESMMEDLMEKDKNNLGVRALQGWYLHKKRRGGDSTGTTIQDHHKTTLTSYDNHDGYALVAMGNIYLTLAREIRPKSAGDEERKQKTYVKAADLFNKALQIDPQNAFAAQGIAIIFAETKRSEIALQIFSKIRETLNDVSVYLNMGHCFFDLRQYHKSIESYETALNQYKGGSDANIMSMLGRAWYARGISEKDINALKQALSYARSASELVPNHAALRFNVAFVQFQIAEHVYRKMNVNQRTVEVIQEASEGLEMAITELQEIAKDSHPPYPAKEIEQRALMGQNTLRKQLERIIDEQREHEKQTLSKLEGAKKKIEEEKRLRQEEAERKRKEAEEREAHLEEERKKLQQQAREWTERRAEEAEKEQELAAMEGAEKQRRKKEKREGGKKQRKESTVEKPKGRSKKSDLSKEFISSDEDDLSFDENDSEKSAVETGDEDEASNKRAGESAGDGATKKKRRIIDDEDEEDDLFGDE